MAQQMPYKQVLQKRLAQLNCYIKSEKMLQMLMPLICAVTKRESKSSKIC